MKVVVDTNVLLNAILPTSGNYWLFDSLIAGQLTFCVTNEILTRFYSPAIAENVLTALIYSPFVQKVDVYFRWQLIKYDPDDDKFVDCAVATNADYIITNDRHFDVLRDVAFPKVLVVRPHELAKEMGRL
jgi:uncharacterized protein